FALNRCARQPCDCVRNQMCVIHPVWFELCCEFRARLASYTFATIAAQTGQGVSPASSLTTLFEALPLG
nr:hypothetical protein [Kofleriaceae bacterium]